MKWNSWLLLTVGLGAICVAVLGFRRVRHRAFGIASRIGLWVGALVFGCLAAVAAYPLDARTRGLGFPFPAAVFQQGPDGIWRDFLGPTTPLFMAIDATIGIGVGLYVLSRLLDWMRARHPKTRAAFDE